VKRSIRSPVWSPDGKLVIYEKVGFKARPQFKPLYSWDPAGNTSTPTSSRSGQ
jgi:hypothetical protein